MLYLSTVYVQLLYTELKNVENKTKIKQNVLKHYSNVILYLLICINRPELTTTNNVKS